MNSGLLKVLMAGFAAGGVLGPVAPEPYRSDGPAIKHGKGQGHGRPGTRSKAERIARKAKRRQRAKARR